MDVQKRERKGGLYTLFKEAVLKAVLVANDSKVK